MPLPSDFSAWDHLQDVWRRVHNRRVQEHFSDLTADDDLNNARSSLRVACRMEDSDTADMTVLRTLLFWVVLGEAAALQPPLYTLPVERYQEVVKFAPQVTLYFREDITDVAEGYKPIDAEVSFRIKNETYQTFTPTNAQTLANRIYNQFGTQNGYRWHKGRIKLNYRDKDNGYQFSVNAYSESEGREVIQKVLAVQNDALQADRLSITELAATPAIVPPLERVYGENRRLPRRRPVGYVRFRYAECHVWGVDHAITLVDLTGRRKNPLIAA